jgi:hypothetical protein
VSPFGDLLICLHKSCFKSKATRELAPDLKFVNSSPSADFNSRSHLSFKIKPDISVYRGSDSNISTESASAEIYFELKWNSGDDPFGSVHGVEQVIDGKTVSVQSFFRETKAAENVLGQVTSLWSLNLARNFAHTFILF